MKVDYWFFPTVLLATILIQCCVPNKDREVQEQISSSLHSIAISLEHMEHKK